MKRLVSDFKSRLRRNPTAGKIVASEHSGYIVRFGISGLLSTAFYFVLMNLIVLAFGMEPVWASVLAYAIAIGFSYTMQSRFTFRVKQDSLNQVTRFVATSLAGLAVSYWTVWLFNDYLKMPYWTGAAVVCVVVPTMNFLIFNRWVFLRR